jgi:hypothetical protein
MISILKWNTARINCFAPGFVLAANRSPSEGFALLKNALLVVIVGKGALLRQFINKMNSLLSITLNVMYAVIAILSAQPVQLKSLSMIPRIRPSIDDRKTQLSFLCLLTTTNTKKPSQHQNPADPRKPGDSLDLWALKEWA